ncbi:beclin 1-associated autophagy-related key regulator [Anabrus simplex]|uniref:beclin 1-associated autophagy-related key regulator n=1 Tax=Anabrus simplex TaxID=316456 RepID=UPI0034DCD617
MATSGSDYSCEAPADFHLSSSTENSGSRFTSSVEKCYLCIKPGKTFYCKQCIQNGDFVHSTGHYSERFAEKQLHLLHWRKKRLLVEDQCRAIILKCLEANRLRCEIDACRERIRFLRLLMEDTKQKITESEYKTATVSEINQHRSERLPRYEERVCKLERYVIQMAADTEKQRRLVHQMQHELKKVIRASIQQLVQYIFPIAQVQPPPKDAVSSCTSPIQQIKIASTAWDSNIQRHLLVVPVMNEDGKEISHAGQVSSADDNVAEDTVCALADATRTAYIRGRWVFTDSSGELQHCIVSPSLPSSGDYSAYSTWVSANKDGVPGGNTEDVGHNPAYNISAALTYTTQLVNVLAFYLDVRLPTRLCYSDFCGHEMTDQQFARRVARLNSNVLHLCFSQNVNPELLHPTRTLQNILHLLNTRVSDLGRQGPLEVDPVLAKSLEDQLAKDLEYNEDSGSEDESDNVPWEWEAVPHIPCPEINVGPISSTVSQQSLTSTHQATSVAGGLVTSAVASLASIWRGWTGNR